MSGANTDKDSQQRYALAEPSLGREGSSEPSAIGNTILECLRLGWTTEEIAAKLRISERTMKLHLRHILRLIDARSRNELMARIKIRN
jgi:DNA-binding NarL/FixJ family response regulator